MEKRIHSSLPLSSPPAILAYCSGPDGLKSPLSESEHRACDHACNPSRESEPPADSQSASGARARQQQLLQAWAIRKSIRLTPEQVDPSPFEALQNELGGWTKRAPTEKEQLLRQHATPEILHAYTARCTELDLSGCGLSTLPAGLQALSSLKILRLGGNPLREFPASLLLALPHLQTLELAMNRENPGEPVRGKVSAFRQQGYQLIHFEQGNAHAISCEYDRDRPTVCYTTDLSPCLAVMILQNSRASCLHVDSYSGKAVGGKSTAEVLRERLTPEEKYDTQIFLVGANDPGSAGNVRGVLACLREFGLENRVSMASLGNGHTSAILDVNKGCAYVGFA